MLIVQITPACNMRWVEFYIIKANPCHCNPTGQARSELIEAKEENASLQEALTEEKTKVAMATASIDALQEEKTYIESKLELAMKNNAEEQSEQISAL